MTDNVRKIFDILGVEPNEIFKVEGYEGCSFTINENLAICKIPYTKDFNYYKWFRNILINPERIIKLLKELKKKKLRDLTPEEWDKRKEICSYTSCSECIFRYVSCIRSDREECWVNHKDLYSDKFLDQEIEVVKDE